MVLGIYEYIGYMVNKITVYWGTCANVSEEPAAAIFRPGVFELPVLLVKIHISHLDMNTCKTHRKVIFRAYMHL
jgi:hypothetical protein